MLEIVFAFGGEMIDAHMGIAEDSESEFADLRDDFKMRSRMASGVV